MTLEPPNHKCGSVLDYCVYHDTKIYFCLYCKKVITAKKVIDDPIVSVDVYVIDSEDKKQHEYDEDKLKEWV